MVVPVNNFWTTLHKPFFCIAPLADVTDPAFRRIIAKYGKPDVVWTEFVSADGLFKGGYDVLIKDLTYTESERPIIAQFFSKDPDIMKQAGKLAAEMGFDGVDINMGCPDTNVCKQGAGAAIIKNPELAKALIRATKEGVHEAGSTIPVSVKTRSGFNEDEIETWIPALLEEKPAALTLHARTKKDMSKVPARWELIARAVLLRNKISPDTLIIGNGDVLNMDDAHAKVKASGCDGIMFGRAIFGNPWLLSGKLRPDFHERLRVLLEHTNLFAELLPHKSFSIMKKHFKSYLHGDGYQKPLLLELMEVKTAIEAREVLIRETNKTLS
ncbi:MAG: tRNA-dihydrouridine synthase [Patescibacteria group bacterium]